MSIPLCEMSYQIRHRELGIFQGVEVDSRGAGICYHPAADSPEMGYCEFKTMEDATKFVSWLLSIDELGYNAVDLFIESYNKRGSDQLQKFGVHLITLEHWVKLVGKAHA